MRRKLVVAGGLIIVAIIAISAANTYLKTHTPTRQLSQKFIGYILKDDASSSYAAFSADAQHNQSQDDWATTVTNLSVFFKGSDPTYVASGTADGKTTETYTIGGVDKNSYNFVVTLIKDNGKWQVYSFISKLVAAPNVTQSSNTGG